MLKYFRNIDKSYWLMAFCVLYGSWPWLQYRVRAIIPFILSLIWFVIVRRNRHPHAPARFRMGFALAVCTFMAASFLNNLYAVFGHGAFTQYYYFAVILLRLSYLICLYVSFKYGKYRELLFLAVVGLIGFSLSGIASLRGASIEGFEGARGMMSVRSDSANWGNLDVAIMALQLGAGGYSHMYYCALMFAPLLMIFWLVKFKTTRGLIAVTLVACGINLRYSGLGTPIAISAFSAALFCVWFLTRKRIVLGLCTFGAFTGVFVFCTDPSMFGFLTSIMEEIGRSFGEETSIGRRFISVAEAFSGNTDAYAYQRYQLQMLSWQTFLRYPIFGIGAYYVPHPTMQHVGGHSLLLDRLAQQGIVGGFFLIMNFVFLYKFLFNLTRTHLGGRRWLSMPYVFIMGYLLVGLMNPFVSMPELIYYMLPGLALLLPENIHLLRFQNRYPLVPRSASCG